MENKSTIGIDISLNTARLVEYSHAKQKILSTAQWTFRSEELADKQVFKEVLHQWILENKQSESVELVTSLSSTKAFIYFSEVQDMQTTDLETLQWEMEQYLGTKFEEGLYHWTTNHSLPQETPLFSVACTKKEIEQIQTLFHFSDLTLTVVDIDTFATANAFKANYPEHLDQTQIVLSADKQGWNLLLMHQGKLQHCKYMPNSSDVENSKDTVSVSEEHIQALSKYLKHPLCKENKPTLVLSGEWASSSIFHAQLEEFCNFPIEILNPFRNISLSKRASTSHKKEGGNSDFAVALGLALRHKGENV